jgi:2-polyprenyl-3-methyl-5-hydroxy-6-metoxy-1,4-benzoquinol methylase
MNTQNSAAAENITSSGVDPDHHVCPWWVGYWLASPIRRLLENPDKLLSPWLFAGMTVVDIGCAMGFFSLPAARRVRNRGRVVCVDVQERVLKVLNKRARRKGLSDIIETRTCTQETLGLDDFRGRADVVVAYHVVHESLCPARLLAECADALKSGGHLLLAEPAGHISREIRDRVFELAEASGLVEVRDVAARGSRAAVYRKP